ncbi:MAG: ribosome assembly RNA-binding protein YhbY [Lachnospiraceae bacterium]|nr:ribosome assembly RNA-binding protein YhbY [Lachnospiraceae bacterium]
MTSKQRSYLKSLASNLDPVFQVGKADVTPELVNAISEALEARELIKINVLKNCETDPKEVGLMRESRTRSECVQVIGRKIVLYRQAKDPKQRKIVLPVK